MIQYVVSKVIQADVFTEWGWAIVVDWGIILHVNLMFLWNNNVMNNANNNYNV